MSDAAAPPVALELWEGSKPLKEGRKAASLARRFGEVEVVSQQTAKIKAEREQHEAAVTSSTCEDPLAAWITYILWMQETFTAGNKEDMIALLERCTSQIVKTDLARYKDDIRFLKVYLLYAENCKDANDVYSVLEQLQIGTCHGLLYEHWANWLEDLRKYDAALETIQLGIYRGVDIEHLTKLRSAVSVRKAEFELERKRQQEEAALLAEQTGTTRSVLGGIASNRTRVPLEGSAPKAAAVRQTQNAAPKIFIPSDEELGAAAEPTSAKPTAAAAVIVSTTEKERHKENTVQPVRWSEVKIPTAAPKVGVAPAAASFTIFDDNAGEAPAPKKKTKKAAAAKSGPPSSRML